ncbi:hypothetical protein PsorP6_004545 [Peronosclerospora sorghi]|uniref:Uncharacterized protein n=1 Tax=Peronosclerospora sorghi TaxID=230839 RepID=A0ACC0VLU0_9STRA|nr:hypothetical protein PsorP6_004545 [Peronosclerospora sorghi]
MNSSACSPRKLDADQERGVTATHFLYSLPTVEITDPVVQWYAAPGLVKMVKKYNVPTVKAGEGQMSQGNKSEMAAVLQHSILILAG